MFSSMDLLARDFTLLLTVIGFVFNTSVCFSALDPLDKGGVAGSSCMDSLENLTLEKVRCSESTLRIELAHGHWF